MLDPGRKRFFLLLAAILAVGVGGAGCQVTLHLPGNSSDAASQPPGNGYPAHAVPGPNGSGSCIISSGRPPPLPILPRLPSRLPWRGPLLGRLRP